MLKYGLNCRGVSSQQFFQTEMIKAYFRKFLRFHLRSGEICCSPAPIVNLLCVSVGFKGE